MTPCEVLVPAGLLGQLFLLLDFLDVLNLGAGTDRDLGAGVFLVVGLEVSSLFGGLLLLLCALLMLFGLLLLLLLQLLLFLLLTLLLVEERGDVFLFIGH